MRRASLVFLVAVCVAGLAHAQEPRPAPRELWNDVFTRRQGRETSHNQFLADVIAGRTPGTALDIGVGDGRNALFLSSQGWDVTGFDISDVAVKMTRDTAQKRGLKLTALIDDADRFDYGRQRWDLVVGMYMHEVITRNAQKIADSLKPRGLLVIEGYQRDVGRQGLQGGPLGYRTNELLQAFARLRVLYYVDTVGPADWESTRRDVPIVRLLAVRE